MFKHRLSSMDVIQYLKVSLKLTLKFRSEFPWTRVQLFKLWPPISDLMVKLVCMFIIYKNKGLHKNTGVRGAWTYFVRGPRLNIVGKKYIACIYELIIIFTHGTCRYFVYCISIACINCIVRWTGMDSEFSIGVQI